MNTTDSTTPSDHHDLVVLSDLHLGEGLREDEPRYSPTEDFFLDQQFFSFLNKLGKDYETDPSRLTLVLNGDVFDFLTVTRVPSAVEATQRGFSVSSAEEKFGLNPTEEKSVYKLDVIAAGHKVFFEALARFIAAGHRVVILRGNHDLELFYPKVRKRLLEHLASVAGGPDADHLARLVSFPEWFYLEPGRVYIEHGNQYDSANSIRYPLHPMLPERRWWKADGEKVLDYPLGSIFVRFFYNRVRRLDPYTPRLLSFDQYLDFIRRYNLFDIWRVYKDHYPQFVSALGPATTTGSARSTNKEDARQSETFVKLAQEDPNGHLYQRLSELKIHPVAASKPNVVKEMVTPIVRRAMWLGIFAFTALFIWFGIFQLIDQIPWLTANAFLMSLFAVLTIGAAFWAWVHLRRKMRRRSVDSIAEGFVDRAEKIADLADVKLVLMGHTHRVDYRRIRQGRSVYVNSGTWTSVDNPWNRIMRDARRMTFVYVRGDAADLCRWNDDAERIDSVPLFYLAEAQIPDNLALEGPFPLETAREHSWLPGTYVTSEEEVLSSTDPPPPPYSSG
ncbi:MAG: metallophosphoesterase [Myxococcota bacterium]|nr:metallophosphoesterase [Myxococcota bacterium]